MAQSRKDNRGRTLRKGEVQRSSDLRYLYTYTDPLGKRRFVYAKDLMSLREKEKELLRDQLDGLDRYTAGRASVNDAFDRYMATKRNLRDSTKSNYCYTYNHFVRDNFGQKKLLEVKYSDVMQYYMYLLNDKELSLSTVDTIHCLLHPAFQLAVRDDVIRKNPTDGVMRELTKRTGMHRGIRHALTVEQQRAFMEYIAGHPVYVHWWPLFTVLLGTGCRIGEAIGLRWEDLDFENRIIDINHSLVHRKVDDSGTNFHINTPKTEAGCRRIPMIGEVYDAFLEEYQIQQITGFCTQEIDGYSGFVFASSGGTITIPSEVNHAIHNITADYNREETANAKREKREPLLLPDFSAHHLRHTFCTRLCENESNIKVIQSVMGHKDVQTTLDIYADCTEDKKKEVIKNMEDKIFVL